MAFFDLVLALDGLKNDLRRIYLDLLSFHLKEGQKATLISCMLRRHAKPELVKISFSSHIACLGDSNFSQHKVPCSL